MSMIKLLEIDQLDIYHLANIHIIVIIYDVIIFTLSKSIWHMRVGC